MWCSRICHSYAVESGLCHIEKEERLKLMPHEIVTTMIVHMPLVRLLCFVAVGFVAGLLLGLLF